MTQNMVIARWQSLYMMYNISIQTYFIRLALSVDWFILQTLELCIFLTMALQAQKFEQLCTEFNFRFFVHWLHQHMTCPIKQRRRHRPESISPLLKVLHVICSSLPFLLNYSHHSGQALLEEAPATLLQHRYVDNDGLKQIFSRDMVFPLFT